MCPLGGVQYGHECFIPWTPRCLVLDGCSGDRTKGGSYESRSRRRNVFQQNPLHHGTARAMQLRTDITLRMPDAQASAADNTLQKYGIFPKSQKNRTKKCLRTPKMRAMTSIKAIEAAASAQRVERKSGKPLRPRNEAN